MAAALARPELTCTAGGLAALKAAVDHGADCVYVGFRDETNARAFAGLNFDVPAQREGVAYAHRAGAKVLVALNTFPTAAGWNRWAAAVDCASELGIDAAICADAALMEYAAAKHPELRLHLSVQASATNYEAINFYRERYRVQRAVLPRVLSLAQVEHTIAHTDVHIGQGVVVADRPRQAAQVPSILRLGRDAGELVHDQLQAAVQVGAQPVLVGGHLPRHQPALPVHALNLFRTSSVVRPSRISSRPNSPIRHRRARQ